MRLHLVSAMRWHSLHAVHVFTLMHDAARETGRFFSAVFTLMHDAPARETGRFLSAVLGADIELRLRDR